MPIEQERPTQVGDLIEISGHHIGEKGLLGEILEVLGKTGHERYRVRWDDGHESDAYYLGPDATIRHGQREPASTTSVS